MFQNFQATLQLLYIYIQKRKYNTKYDLYGLIRKNIITIINNSDVLSKLWTILNLYVINDKNDY